MNKHKHNALSNAIDRLSEALAHMTKPDCPETDFSASDIFVWQTCPGYPSAGWSSYRAQSGYFRPVHKKSRLPLDLLCGIDDMKQRLLDNTRQFAAGYPANDALLWGARGMGKSSLVKAVHARIAAEAMAHSPDWQPLLLIEIHRDDINSLPDCLLLLRDIKARVLLLCDDLSFDPAGTSYKSLKSVLDGGVEAKPDNVLLYATSNRRHLMPRDMIENEMMDAIHPRETSDEKIALSDRFGLWIGFHPASQADYLEMIDAYARHFELISRRATLHREALAWAAGRGARSGRVAWQFIQHMRGQEGVGGQNQYQNHHMP